MDEPPRRVRSAIQLADLPYLLERAVSSATHPVTIVDARIDDLPLVYANDAFLRLTGYPAREVLGRNCRFLQGPDTDPAQTAALAAALAGGVRATVVLLNYRRDHTPFWNELHLSPVHTPGGLLTHFLGYQTDVTDRVRHEQRLAYLADHDDRTGLANRTAALTHLDHLIEANHRDNVGITVLYIDLDDFHRVNDTYDYETGNTVLTALGRRLASTLTADGLLARLDGDSFLLVLPTSAAEAARHATQTIHAALATPIAGEAVTVQLRASTGHATYPHDGLTGPELIQHAKTALQQTRTTTDKR